MDKDILRDESKYYTVTAINNYIAYKLSTDVALKIVYIKGELSNCRVSKGHLYFILKDNESEISGIMFASLASRLSFMPKDGMKVLITGTVNPYPKKGTYNLIANEIIEYGKGYLYQRFLESKQRLEEIGLFDKEHKKKIPMFSENIGVVTSSNGDAINDIISTIEKRYPLCKVFLYPALVQGEDAPKSLIRALNLVSRDNLVDVVIIARGGGSFEDLNCFNDEFLAKTIYEFPIPIVSGVGHENDYTICDFVCDERAPTPTGAAVLVTTDKSVIYEMISNAREKISYYTKKIIDNNYTKLDFLQNNYYFKSIDNVLATYYNDFYTLNNSLMFNSPLYQINNEITKVSNLSDRLKRLNLSLKFDNELDKLNQLNVNINKSLINKINTLENEYIHLIDKLILVNPLNIMKKGYTIVYKEHNVISSSSDVNIDDELTLSFYDGNKKVKVIE